MPLSARAIPSIMFAMEQKIPIAEVLNFFSDNGRISGATSVDAIENISTANSANEKSLTWVKWTSSEEHQQLQALAAAVVIAPLQLLEHGEVTNKLIVGSNNPRLLFAKFLNHFFTPTPQAGIHPTATVDPQAQIDNTACIGPYCFIGKAKIGAGTSLAGNNVIYDQVTIGKNVQIHAGAVIGAEGFGFVKDDDGNNVPMKHIAGVVLEDNVYVGANASIVRGVLSDTVVKRGAKIDALVQVGHNSKVGENSLVIAGSVIGGSATLGANSWMSINSSISNKCSMGENSTIGMGASAQVNIPENTTFVSGVPGKSLPNHFFKEK